MAAIRNVDRVRAQQRFYDRDNSVCELTKGEFRAALEAVEDWYQAHKVDGATRIETAVPGKFTNAEKRRLFEVWCDLRFATGLD